MQRRNFDGPKIRNSLGQFPESVRATALEEKVLLIDLTKMSVEFYEALGPDKSALAFSGGRDITHHSGYGAYELAKCVLESIRQSRLDLTKFIVEDYVPFQPGTPDPPESFTVPSGTGQSNLPPRGN